MALSMRACNSDRSILANSVRAANINTLEDTMRQLLPDETFYPSATMAMTAPPETIAYVTLLNPDPEANDS